MLFNSVSYLIFLPLVFTAYWLSPKGIRRGLLLAASYYFYMSWLRIYGLLLLCLTLVNYCFGLALDRFRNESKPILIAGLSVNLGTLCFFKYTGFMLSSASAGLNLLAPWLTLPANLTAVNIILPLGISFFVFEFIHYLTDIYRADRPIGNIVDFGLFAAFFPSQIAGPIKRYQDFISQLGTANSLSSQSFHKGLTLIAQGIFKKAALSDNLAPLVAAGFQQSSSAGTADAWVATSAFALQIYFDFSGYTDIGRGSAFLFGFALPDNFNFPYMAANLSDFWRRWHISLSTWLRDYLYIPMGGSKVSLRRKNMNLLVTMLLGGLWHGAAWHYVAWGAYHGVGLVACHEYEALVRRGKALSNFHRTRTGRVMSMVLTLFAVLVGWILFRADTVSGALQILCRHFTYAPGGLVTTMLWQSSVPVALAVYALYALLQSNFARRHLAVVCTVYNTIFNSPSMRSAAYAGAFVAALGFCPMKAEPFIYFQF